LPTELLTDARLRAAAPPPAGILELWDTKTSGLCFRVMPSGVRSWSFRYIPATGAKLRRATLGRYPQIGLADARPGEVAGMARDELVRLGDAREAAWEIPPERMKARRPHVVPLPPFARGLVEAAMASRNGTAGEGGFIFASRFADRQRLARHSLSQALRRVIDGLEAVGEDAEAVARLKADPPTPHDLRRTLASGLSRLGIPREDRQAVLAHVHDDVHAVYDRYERTREKRIALEAWERHVSAVLANAPGYNVLQLRRR